MKWLCCLVLTGCLVGGKFGGGKSGKEAQRDTMQAHFMPAPLSTEATWKGPIKDASIRVYADDQYRTQNMNWRHTFDETLEYVNAVLRGEFGIRLVADYREWNRHEPGATLDDDLAQLEALDNGDDVLAVIGLTSSLSLVSATFDQLGYARLPGRHLMMRGYADIDERAAFGRAFPDLSTTERDNALHARRMHKNATILLHELGHNLGVSHEHGNDALMAPNYSEHVVGFSPEAHAMMMDMLDQRLGRGSFAGAPRPVPAAVVAKAHTKVHVHVSAKTFLFEGIERDLDELIVLFGVQAADDADTEVVISKDKGVPQARVTEVIDRAKQAGLKNFAAQ
ncbi:MAG: matrixin family metalloprotease [Kofleriaceae bacterium]|nr:matrixin family metalloprotease [Kofleriaceae bacterium]